MSRCILRRLRSLGRIVRDAWLVVGLSIVLIAALELGLRGAFALKDRAAGVQSPDPRVVQEGYGGESWPVVHYRELEALSDRWEPYVYFRQRPFQGRTITIDADGRRAVRAAEPGPARDAPPFKLLVLGGSSLWGFGARDEGTIPSRLVAALQELGGAVEVRNLAEIGYVSGQETIALIRELASGYRPDAVLFYDGVNDTTSALLEGKAGLTTNERNRAREFNLLQAPGRMTAAAVGRVVGESALQRVARSIGRRVLGAPESAVPALPAADLDALAESVVDAYLANLDVVDALAARYGFRTLFAWQPTVFDRASPTAFEREEAAKYAWLAPIFARVAEAKGRREGLQARPDFLDLSRVLADAPELVFIDYCHTTERANARIADRLAGPVLQRLRPSGSDGATHERGTP